MSAGISIILVVILIILSLVTSDRITEKHKKHELVEDMARGIAELDIVGYDYLLHGEKRMEQQWNLKYNSLAKILDEAEEETFKIIRADFIAVGDIFSQVTTNYKKRQRLIQEEVPQKMIDAAAGIEERLVAQLLITSHSIITSASRLADGASAEETEARKLAANLTLILIIFLAITVTTSSLLVARSISKPLNELIKGIEIIGGGNLEPRIVVRTKNELGQLASSFNKMAKDLQEITVSNDKLEEEITERKKVEEELEKHRENLEGLISERTQELQETMMNLEQSNQELEQFAYVASHDLQEPLRMVSSYTQLLAKRYQDQLDQDAKEFIHFAVDGANRMQILIQDLLSYARVGSRGQSLEPTDSNSALGQALVNLRTAVHEGNVLVTNDELPVVLADKTQLAQVFQNLISNSIKFRGDEAPRIHIKAEQKDGEYTFSVSDNGIGIDPEYHEKIFVIFQRLHQRNEYSGTGIGLSLCKRIVERHGGQIWLESTLGKGSTFYFTLKTGGEES